MQDIQYPKSSRLYPAGSADKQLPSFNDFIQGTRPEQALRPQSPFIFQPRAQNQVNFPLQYSSASSRSASPMLRDSFSHDQHMRHPTFNVSTNSGTIDRLDHGRRFSTPSHLPLTHTYGSQQQDIEMINSSPGIVGRNKSSSLRTTSPINLSSMLTEDQTLKPASSSQAPIQAPSGRFQLQIESSPATATFSQPQYSYVQPHPQLQQQVQPQQRSHQRTGHHEPVEPMSSTGFYTTSAYLLSSTDTEGRARHRLSEKHRRDGQGVFIRCSDILRRGIQTYTCRLCDSTPKSNPAAEEEQKKENDDNIGTASTTSPTRTSDSTSTSNSTPAYTRMKRAKNDQLAEGLIWEFLIILHHCPEQLPERIWRIEALAEQMARDKVRGRERDRDSSSSTRNFKGSDDDVRDIVAGQILQRIISECERHGIDPRTGKHMGHDDAEALSPTKDTNGDGMTTRRPKRKWDWELKTNDTDSVPLAANQTQTSTPPSTPTTEAGSAEGSGGV